MVNPVTTLEKFLKIFGWIPQVRDILKPLKPEIRTLTVNYATQRSEIRFALNIPDDLNRRTKKVKIPRYDNFKIKEMMDETFHPVNRIWNQDSKYWILNPSSLPGSSSYLLILEGSIPIDALNKMVVINKAINQDTTEDLDRYWLSCSLKDTELLEKLWQNITMKEVPIDVHITMERIFAIVIPSSFSKLIRSTKDWIDAGTSSDRSHVFREWIKRRKTMSHSSISPDRIIGLILDTTNEENISRYLSVNKPFSLGKILPHEVSVKPYPDRMRVQALSDLSLKTPQAQGYLSFKKREFQNELKQRFDELEPSKGSKSEKEKKKLAKRQLDMKYKRKKKHK